MSAMNATSSTFDAIPKAIRALQEHPPKPLRAFHGSAELKTFYVQRVRAHREADQLVKGVYWEHGKGCAVGCTLHSGKHSDYERELGVPTALAKLEDGIFEDLPNDEATAWPEAFLEAIAPRADLSMVMTRFLHWLLVDSTDGVLRLAKTNQERDAIGRVAELLSRKIDGGNVSRKEWQDAADYADAAAASAATYATYAAYAYAAYAAASAASTACAACAAYVSVTRGLCRIRQSEKLLKLMRGAPLLEEGR